MDAHPRIHASQSPVPTAFQPSLTRYDKEPMPFARQNYSSKSYGNVKEFFPDRINRIDRVFLSQTIEGVVNKYWWKISA